jgi:hypothetical protein
MVRAKFVVTEIARNKYGQEEQQSIRMQAVTSGSEENKKFFRWTPSGKIELNTVNPEAGNQFELGKEYYIDFTIVEEVTKKDKVM